MLNSRYLWNHAQLRAISAIYYAIATMWYIVNNDHFVLLLFMHWNLFLIALSAQAMLSYIDLSNFCIYVPFSQLLSLEFEFSSNF